MTGKPPRLPDELAGFVERGQAAQRAVNLQLAAEDLREQEFARLAATVTPRLDMLRSMSLGAFRSQVAMMMERLGHSLVTDPSAADLVTIKDGEKFIVACARPGDLAATPRRDLARLHDAVVAANAKAGLFITPRGFTGDAVEYAAAAPVRLIDGEMLVRLMQRSLRGVAPAETYKAMCRQCGDVVEHSIDKGEALPCSSGHLIPPTIARAALIPPEPRAPAAGERPAHAPRHGRPKRMTAKAVNKRRRRAHMHKLARRLAADPGPHD